MKKVQVRYMMENKKNLDKAFENIKKCLELDPVYPNAKKIHDGLLKVYNSKK